MKILYSVFHIIFFLLVFSLEVSAQLTWGKQISGTSQRLNSVAFFDSVTGLSVGNGGTILRSTDGGVNWSPSFSGTFSPILSMHVHTATTAFTTEDSGCFDAGCGVIRRTTDTGNSWTQAYSGGLYYDISFADSLHGIAAGGGYDFGGDPYITAAKTLDGGESWISLTSSLYHLKMVMRGVAFVDTGFCIAIANDSSPYDKILRSNNFSQSWVILDSSYSNTLYAVDFIDTTTGIVVGSSGLITVTTDGGQTWNQQTSGTLHHLRGVQMLSPLEAHVVGDGGMILYTSDGGTTWIAETSNTTQNLHSLFFTDAQHGWAVGSNGTIVKYGSFSGCHIPDNPIDFGDVVEMQMRKDSVLVTNTGTDTVSISSTVIGSGEFGVDPSSIAIAPGLSAYVRIIFSPADPGTENAKIIFTHNGPTSPDTVAVLGSGLDFGTTLIEVQEKWNLLANPRKVLSDSLHDMFPSAITSAFKFDADSGYQSSDRLENGTGYWLKFSAAESVNVDGLTITSDTVSVHAGWNLIGTISVPVDVSSVVAVSTSITSPFFGYNLGYFSAATLLPGWAYWVKVSTDGNLILSGP